MVGQEAVNLQVLGKTDENLHTVGFWAMGRWTDTVDTSSALESNPQSQRRAAGEPQTVRVQRHASGAGEDGDEDFKMVAPRSGVLYFLQMPTELKKGHQIDRQTGV